MFLLLSFTDFEALPWSIQIRRVYSKTLFWRPKYRFSKYSRDFIRAGTNLPPLPL